MGKGGIYNFSSRSFRIQGRVWGRFVIPPDPLGIYSVDSFIFRFFDFLLFLGFSVFYCFCIFRFSVVFGFLRSLYCFCIFRFSNVFVFFVFSVVFGFLRSLYCFCIFVVF